MVSGNGAIEMLLQAIRAKFEVKTLILEVSNDKAIRAIWITRAMYKRFLDTDGYPVIYVASIDMTRCAS